MTTNRYKLALFIGRFQPFHNGHLYSLKKSLEIAEMVLIGLGSSQESGTESNPWNYESRKEMVEAVVMAERLDSKLAGIVPIPDFPKDEDWVDYVQKIIINMGYKKSEVVVVGNNDWTNGVLRTAGFAVFESGLRERELLEGVKIRGLLNKNDESWKDRVPAEVSKRIG